MLHFSELPVGTPKIQINDLFAPFFNALPVIPLPPCSGKLIFHNDELLLESNVLIDEILPLFLRAIHRNP